MAHTHLAWFVSLTALAALAACALDAPPLRAQQQSPPPPTEPALGAYREPTIALVQPTNGGTVPQDQPVVVFRFAPGELGDPIDARSFAVSVDGQDRTPLFKVTAGEAWGPLTAPAPGRPGDAIAAGPHQIVARICSVRGACASAAATVSVAPSAHGGPPPDKAKRRARVIDRLLSAVRELLLP